MKYIVYKQKDGSWEEVVIFPDRLAHDVIANKLSLNPVSAGFVSMAKGEMLIGGGSLTLAIDSRPQDAEIIKKIFSE